MVVSLPQISITTSSLPDTSSSSTGLLTVSASVTFRNPQDRFQGATRTTTTATITSHPSAHCCLPRVLSIHTPPVVSATNTSPEQCPCPRRRLSATASYGETSVRHFPCGIMPGVRFSHILIVECDVNSLNCSDVLKLHWPILVLRLPARGKILEISWPPL